MRKIKIVIESWKLSIFLKHLGNYEMVYCDGPIPRLKTITIETEDVSVLQKRAFAAQGECEREKAKVKPVFKSASKQANFEILELADRVEKALLPAPMCRDCADYDGRCPNTGELCDSKLSAKEVADKIRELVK